MLHEEFAIQVEGSLPETKMVTYIQEYTDRIAIKKRPLILMCPGGGYGFTSPREAEPMAFAFLNMGYNVAILYYSCYPAHYPTALFEAATAVKHIRKNAEKWHVDPQGIIMQGCSAGGHLAASYCCFWDRDPLKDFAGKEELKPNGLILSYPVISSGKYAHRGSFECLIGKEHVDEKGNALDEKGKELLEKTSLEKQVASQLPPTFIWHTYEDKSVPVKNTLLFADALYDAKIPLELHIFPKGAHGLSLASELTAEDRKKEVQPACQIWIELAKSWLREYFPL
ncbi:MAG: alpha/beta hydrolase [Lachnospiraceae bacterium]|nr:alpha/beta hydrolase [Lachnospiraceae bacterium]